jgi:hypothetical protein
VLVREDEIVGVVVLVCFGLVDPVLVRLAVREEDIE